MAGYLRCVQITIFQVRLLKKIETIKDLGVTFDNKLKVDDNINNEISTYSISNVKRFHLFDIR